jgi:hypothetical protein
MEKLLDHVIATLVTLHCVAGHISRLGRLKTLRPNLHQQLGGFHVLDYAIGFE